MKFLDYVDYADRACCQAVTADCLACTEGISVEEFCLDNPDIEGCPSKYIDTKQHILECLILNRKIMKRNLHFIF